MSILGLMNAASGIIDGVNPSFTASDFLQMMPMFDDDDVVDYSVVERYVEQAHAVVKEARWHELWREGMRLYIAHFLTLYIQTMPVDGSGKLGVINASTVNGVATSKSVGEVSVSYDINVGNGDLTGWSAYKLTTYGTQFATLARLLGKSGMYVR